MPELVGWSQKRLPGQTCHMAKARTNPTKGSRAKHIQAAAAVAAVQASRRRTAEQRSATKPMPGVELPHPLEKLDALDELRRALEAVGIDPHKQAQPDSFLQDQWHVVGSARTEHAELVALAVEHANDARAQASSKPSTMREVHQEADALRDLVRATILLRHNLRLPEGLEDDRKPLLMDGEIIGLVGPQDDARSALVTLKLPQVVIDRLRDAVAAIGGRRTMAGIAALGITMVLDVLEAESLKHTGKRFPKRPGQVLEGGRPSRTRATTAQKAPGEPKAAKKARLRR